MCFCLRFTRRINVLIFAIFHFLSVFCKYMHQNLELFSFNNLTVAVLNLSILFPNTCKFACAFSNIF